MEIPLWKKALLRCRRLMTDCHRLPESHYEYAEHVHRRALAFHLLIHDQREVTLHQLQALDAMELRLQHRIEKAGVA